MIAVPTEPLHFRLAQPVTPVTDTQYTNHRFFHRLIRIRSLDCVRRHEKKSYADHRLLHIPIRFPTLRSVRLDNESHPRRLLPPFYRIFSTPYRNTGLMYPIKTTGIWDDFRIFTTILKITVHRNSIPDGNVAGLLNSRTVGKADR